MRALTALKNAGTKSQQADGRPPEMPLTKIVRDPQNPRPPLHLRTPDEQQQQIDLNENIRQRGVKSPISLRPHPSEPDTWVINHGHCRYDAAEAAGLATIPYFVDPNFDSYDQVAENLHRCDLSIWAIAGFIKRKLDEGQSKTEIAHRLGKDGLNYVTEHLALVDAPGCVHQAYACAVRSPRTLYDLRRAHDEFPEQVDAWCLGGARITRDTIRELLDKLRHDVITAVPTQGGEVYSSGPEPEAQAHARDESGGEISLRPIPDTWEATQVRHDVIVLCPQDDGPTLNSDDEERRFIAPTGTDRGLRHGVTQQQPPSPARSKSVPATVTNQVHRPASDATLRCIAGQEIPVRYRGRNATTAADTKVTITVDGEKAEALLGELEFLKVDGVAPSEQKGASCEALDESTVDSCR